MTLTPCVFSGRGRGRGRGDGDKEEWVPCTKLGRLVKAGKIKSLEHIYLFSMPIKEYEIVDWFLGPPGSNKLKDEVMKVQPVQKQTRAGQRTRFKAFVLVGDFDGHVGLGVKVGKEVANAIRGAILAAKMAVVPVRRGYWGKKIGLPHTVPNKIHGKCGSVHIRLVPAPRGTGIVAAPTSKKILQYAGIADCFTSSSGSSATLGNFAKATFNALSVLYGYLTPDLWKETKFTKQPFQEFTDDLTGNTKHIKSRGIADKFS
jgi:small subunit ribosomal protein S2e